MSTTTIVNQRVLPGFENFLDNAIVILSNSLLDTDSEIRITLIAPGLSNLIELRNNLCTWLKQSLTPIDPNWVYDVAVKSHFETGEPEIVVTIDDTDMLNSQSLDLILGHVKTFVAPFAVRNWARVYTLKGAQRLVPLTFERPLTTTAMSVTLPEPLSLRQPKGFFARELTRNALHGADVSMGSTAAACAYLAAAVELACDELDWIDNVVVSPSIKGTHVAVNFNYRAPAPTPFTINTTQTVIMEVLKQHAILPRDVHNDLVFVSTTPMGDNDYDDGGDYGNDGEY